MKALMIIAAVILGAPSEAAKSPNITSVYTKIDANLCETTEEGEAYSASRCPGYAGIFLFAHGFDARSDLNAGVEDSQENWGSGAMDHIGEGIEWRLANGKPFAIIYRLIVDPFPASPPPKKLSHLIVETIRSDHHGGCRIAMIDGAGLKANVLARAAADAILKGKTRCMTQQEQMETL